MDFGIIWEQFPDNFQVFSKNAETGILLKKLRKINDFAPPKPPFSNQNSINTSSSGTKRNNGKRQEQVDNFRNMQKSNASKNTLIIQTPVDNLQAAKRGFQPSLKTI